MSRDTRKHASHVSEEGKSYSSDPRLDVLKACAVLHLHIRYVDKSADPKNASQATHVERLLAIYIMPCIEYCIVLRKVQVFTQ